MVMFGVAHEQAYNKDAATRLESIPGVPELIEHCLAGFLDAMANDAEGARILDAMIEDDFTQLQTREVQHLRLLFSPELSMAEHQSEAQRLGRAHALVGIELQGLIESFALLQQQVRDDVLPLVPAEHRERVLEIVERRIFVDLKAQAATYQRIDTELALVSSQIDDLIQQTANFSDLIRGVMGLIGGMEGDISAFFARCDANGELQIEAS